MRVSTAGKLLYYLIPVRRGVVRENLRRVYGDALPDEEVTRLAQSHYGHLGRLALEFLRFSFVPAATRAALVRVENVQALEAALSQGKGVLVLTGHFGNWEVATAAGLAAIRRRAGDSISSGVRSSHAGLTDWSRDGLSARASESCRNAVG